MSRINAVCSSCTEDILDSFDFNILAKEQEKSDEIASYRTADIGVALKDIKIGTKTLLCDTSTGDPRSVLPTFWTCQVFNQIHKLSDSGVRPTERSTGLHGD